MWLKSNRRWPESQMYASTELCRQSDSTCLCCQRSVFFVIHVSLRSTSVTTHFKACGEKQLADHFSVALTHELPRHQIAQQVRLTPLPPTSLLACENVPTVLVCRRRSRLAPAWRRRLRPRARFHRKPHLQAKKTQWSCHTPTGRRRISDSCKRFF